MADRISTLPDEVLCHILSFLPTQDAVSTIVLSKRWTPVWRSVPSLDFDDNSYFENNKKPYDCFVNFVHSAIRARDSHQPVKSFRLKCWNSYFDSDYDGHLSKWVESVLQHGLENLHLEIPDDTSIWSSSIFNCKTLVDLKLFNLEAELLPFDSVDLPSLKTLHLNRVWLPDTQILKEVLCSCPNLEDMYVRDIRHAAPSCDSIKNFEYLSKLVRADIYDTRLDIPLKVICNVEFLRIDKYLVDDIPVFPNLTHLELIWEKDLNWHLVLELLKQCPKLQNLVFQTMTNRVWPFIHIVSESVWPFPNFIPECFSSQLRKCSIINYNGMIESQLHFAKYVLQNSIVLQNMRIYTASTTKLKYKFKMLKELSVCPRSSTRCELIFE